MIGSGPPDALVEAFDEQRARLVAVAYRMLGSRADAEDAVQEAWLRLARQDPGSIENLAGWLTTVVGRVCIDVLRSRNIRPEASYDEHLPSWWWPRTPKPGQRTRQYWPSRLDSR